LRHAWALRYIRSPIYYINYLLIILYYYVFIIVSSCHLWALIYIRNLIFLNWHYYNLYFVYLWLVVLCVSPYKHQAPHILYQWILIIFYDVLMARRAIREPIHTSGTPHLIFDYFIIIYHLSFYHLSMVFIKYMLFIYGSSRHPWALTHFGSPTYSFNYFHLFCIIY